MKFQLTFKSEHVYEQCEDICKEQVSELSRDPDEDVHNYMSALGEKIRPWVSDFEYVTIEINTYENTATVVSKGG